MRLSSIKFIFGLILAMWTSECFALEMGLAPVAFTFAVTKKQWTGSVYQRDEFGKEIKTLPLTDQETYTVSSKDGSTKTYTQFGRKSITTKLGNREVLSALNEDGSLDGTIAGWTLMAQPAVDTEEGSISYQIYAYKASTQGRFDLFTVSATTEMTGTGSFVESKNASGETVSLTASGSATYEQAVSIGDDKTLGLFTCSVTLKTYLQDPNDKMSLNSLMVPSAAKIANIVGNDEDGGSYSGTISFAASKAVTLQ